MKLFAALMLIHPQNLLLFTLITFHFFSCQLSIWVHMIASTCSFETIPIHEFMSSGDINEKTPKQSLPLSSISFGSFTCGCWIVSQSELWLCSLIIVHFQRSPTGDTLNHLEHFPYINPSILSNSFGNSERSLLKGRFGRAFQLFIILAGCSPFYCSSGSLTFYTLFIFNPHTRG